MLLGINVGGTTTSVVVGNRAGAIHERVAFATDSPSGPEPLIAQIVTAGRAYIERFPQIERIGVAIGGPMDANAGIIYDPPNLPGWTALPLRARLEFALARPVQVEHDAGACAWAEFRFGDHGAITHLAYLTCGTGFGTGLVLAGKLYRGAHGRSPEIGHVRYIDAGPAFFEKPGCFEALGPGRALSAIAAWRYPARWGADAPTPPELGALAATGDADACDVLAYNARVVGDACALLADLLVVERIVLGSAAMYLGPSWVAHVEARFHAQVLPSVAAACRVVPSTLGDRLQDCSGIAAALA